MHDLSRVVVIFLLPLVLLVAATAVMLSLLISLSNTLLSLILDLVENETRHLLFLLLV